MAILTKNVFMPHPVPPFRIIALASALMAGGCAVGPDFTAPPAPDVAAYDSKDGAENNPADQKFMSGQDVPAEWWKLFRSAALDKIVGQALAANPDMQAAEAALRQADENYAATTGALLPSVSGNAGASREKISPAQQGMSSGGIPAFTLYNASVNVSYALDVFGGARRAVEAAEAGVDVQRYERDAARQTLIANVVTAAIGEASLRAQIAATTEVIEAERKQLDLLRQQLDMGGIAKAAVLAEAAQLAETRATLPPLEQQLAQIRHQLSALCGRFPAEEIDARFNLESLHLPEELPVSLPSRLVEHRPDIRAATSQLHAASAGIGVATAVMLPQISLNASYGADSGTLDKLLSPSSAVWNLGAGLAQPIFEGGALLHKRDAAEAAYDKAAAQYRGAVLAAFQNVADSLRAIQSDSEAFQQQSTAERAARDSLELSREQFDAGAVSYLAVLTAEQTSQQTEIALAQASARRFADTAALFHALGDGG